MLNRNRNRQAWVALPTALSLILYPAVPLVSAQTPTAPATTQAPKKAPAAPVRTQLHDGGWPKSFGTPTGGGIVVYTPQVNSWDGQKLMITGLRPRA